MNWLEYIMQNFSDFLLYFIPGYICLRITEIYGPRKLQDEVRTVILSILYSYIIVLVYTMLRSLVFSVPCLLSISKWIMSKVPSGTIRSCCCLVLGVVQGYVLLKLPKTKVGLKYGEAMNRNSMPEPVWLKAMAQKSGAWARVYLKNNLYYIGALTEYTMDPSESEKKIILTNCECGRVIGGENPNSTHCFIRLYQQKRNDIVLLRYDDITAIEIMPADEEGNGHVDDEEGNRHVDDSPHPTDKVKGARQKAEA